MLRMSLIKSLIISYILILNYIFILIFGDFYKLIIKKVLNAYSYASKLLLFQSNHENLLNDTLVRMERTEDKMNALHNQMVSLQRLVEDLQNKSHECSGPLTSLLVPPLPPLPPKLISRPERLLAMGSKNGLTATINQMIGEDCSRAKKQSDLGLSSQIIWHLLSGDSEAIDQRINSEKRTIESNLNSTKSGRNPINSFENWGNGSVITRRLCNCNCHEESS